MLNPLSNIHPLFGIFILKKMSTSWKWYKEELPNLITNSTARVNMTNTGSRMNYVRHVTILTLAYFELRKNI